MYYIDSVTNNYNYEENVVLTMLFAKSEDGKELFSKPISQDKTEEELDSFTEQNPAEVFSAGDGSDDNDSSDSRKIFKKVGSFSVKDGEEFIFAPEEEAT